MVFLHKIFLPTVFMLKEHVDNTKSFRILLSIYDTLLLHHGVQWNEFNARWKNAGTVKKALADKVKAPVT